MTLLTAPMLELGGGEVMMLTGWRDCVEGLWKLIGM